MEPYVLSGQTLDRLSLMKTVSTAGGVVGLLAEGSTKMQNALRAIRMHRIQGYETVSVEPRSAVGHINIVAIYQGHRACHFLSSKAIAQSSARRHLSDELERR